MGVKGATRKSSGACLGSRIKVGNKGLVRLFKGRSKGLNSEGEVNKEEGYSRGNESSDSNNKKE